MSTKKAGSALRSRIAKVALAELGQENLYIAGAPVGKTLSNLDVELLQKSEGERLDDEASASALVNLSRRIDCIQVQQGKVATPLDADPRYLSDVFPQLINNVNFLKAPLSEEEQRRYKQAEAILYKEPPFIKTEEFQEFCLLRSEVERMDVRLAEMRLRLKNEKNPDEKEALITEVDFIEKLCTQKREALEALDRAHSLSAAEDIFNTAERRIDEVPESVRTMLDTMEIFKISDPNTNDTHVACSFLPSQLVEDNWVPVRLTQEDIARGKEPGDNSTSDLDEIDDSDIDSIDVEVQTLVCERPWLWSPLFENRRWDWATPSPPISTGSNDEPERGLIPGLIHALIFSRKLTIKLKAAGRSLAATQPPSGLSILKNLTINPTAAFPRAGTPTLPANQSGGKVAFPNVKLPPNVTLPNEKLKLPVSAWKDLYLKSLSSVKGSVIDEHKRGIYQATVMLITSKGAIQRRVMTGRDGSFNIPMIGSGNYFVSVAKDGFTAVKDSIKVPLTTPKTFVIRQKGSCQLLVRLLLDNGQPFVGPAKIHIQGGGKDRRLESMDERSEAIFSLPPGDFIVSVNSPEAERISPANKRITLRAGSSAHQKLLFTISPASVLRDPDVQLLGYVCRRVPRSPNPESGATGG